MSKTLKRIIMALAISASSITMAHAEGDVAFLTNKIGGKIIITDINCTDGEGSITYTKLSGGKVLFGCWRYYSGAEGEQVMVKWSDGDVYTYPVSSFNFTEYGDKTYNKPRI